MTRTEYKVGLKRLMRQLDQRNTAVKKGLRKDQHIKTRERNLSNLLTGQNKQTGL